MKNWIQKFKKTAHEMKNNILLSEYTDYVISTADLLYRSKGDVCKKNILEEEILYRLNKKVQRK